jgi:hypothetical protein
MGPPDRNYEMMRGVYKTLDKEWLKHFHVPLSVNDKLAKGLLYKMYAEFHQTPAKHGVYSIGILKDQSGTKTVG